MDDNVEQVLVVYSTSATDGRDIETAKRVVADYVPEDPGAAIRVEATVFCIPDAVPPGGTLSAELRKVLDECVGALVFVDDLRPNVTYELGYLHGRGRPVLLLTRRRLDEVWLDISDLAGAALVDLDRTDLAATVQRYLHRLYTQELARAPQIPLLSLPAPDNNLLVQLGNGEGFALRAGDYGPILTVDRYNPPVNVPLGRNLLSGASLTLLLRSSDELGDYTVHTRVRFRNRLGRRRRVWLGVTSLRRDTGITREERLFPGRSPTPDWRILSLDLTDLLDRGFLLGAQGPDYIECIRLRAGARGRTGISPIEIGYLGISGVAE